MSKGKTNLIITLVVFVAITIAEIIKYPYELVCNNKHTLCEIDYTFAETLKPSIIIGIISAIFILILISIFKKEKHYKITNIIIALIVFVISTCFEFLRNPFELGCMIGRLDCGFEPTFIDILNPFVIFGLISAVIIFIILSIFRRNKKKE